MINKQILVGRVGQEPETKTFPNGGMIMNISVATENRWKDRQTGEQQSVTTWHRVVLRNKLAEIGEKILFKGCQVYIEGRTDHRKWADPQSGEEKVSVEIVASELRALSSKEDRERAGGNHAPAKSSSPDYGDYPDDDIDF